MSREGSFSYTASGRCSLDAAVALLSDPRRQVELHPLITGVKRLADDAAGHARYAISDRLKWGPFAFPITYEATILSVTGDEILTSARQKPTTTVRNHTRLSTNGGIVRADVEITLRAPNLLFGYAFAQAKTAHLKLGERISQTFDQLGSS